MTVTRNATGLVVQVVLSLVVKTLKLHIKFAAFLLTLQLNAQQYEPR